MNRKLQASRRAFLRKLSAGAALMAGACKGEGHWSGTAPSASPLDGQSKVVIARDPELRGSGSSLDSNRLLGILDRAVQSFYDCDSAVEAWKRVARPGEVVGLKVNCLAGRGISTNVPLVEAICERLQQAGTKADQIVIWDRLSSDLESARFRVAERGSGIRCFGNDTLGYDPELAVYGSVGSMISNTLTRVVDAVINLPVLKDHGITGVTLALKNVFGAIHNPNKYHLTVGDPYIADVNMLPAIRKKIRLTICDAITAQYEGGPSFMPQWTWPYNGLIVGTDPVALDYTGWQIIERKRAEKGMKSLKEMKREPVYIRTAADPNHRLGTNDPHRIKVVEA
jgi:uncharacterized protein (DUF362 family)